VKLLNSRRRPTDRRHKAPLSRGVQIIFEDKDIIVVDKPEGLLTIATDREKLQTLYAYLFEHVKRKKPPEMLFIVHRLDREASGLLVFAKSELSKHQLQDQFKEHSASRTYLAITEGQMSRNDLTIESYLAENRMHRCYSTRDRAKGKRAVTHVRVLKRSQHRTLVEVRLETGRKHQIRVHLAEHGHPIVGDRAYGSGSNPVRRLALHATKLAFKHPQSGKSLEFTSQPPAMFASLI
jgi:23S rRNA pseudouridine1911/1915/1917 synthase